MRKIYAVEVKGKFQSPVNKFHKVDLVINTKCTDDVGCTENEIKASCEDNILRMFDSRMEYRDIKNWKFESTVKEI